MLSTVFEQGISELCPMTAPFFGFMGVAASIIFASTFLPFARITLYRRRFGVRNG